MSTGAVDLSQSLCWDGAPLDPGLYPGVPERDYHRWPGASQSRLKVLREETPAELRWQIDHPSETTPALLLGAAIHDFVLLPDLAPALWVRGIEGDGRTKAVQEARAALVLEHPTATVLPAEDYDVCLAVRDAIAAHPKARQLLTGRAEVSAVWRDEGGPCPCGSCGDQNDATSALCRGRFDLLGERTGTIVDLKSTLGASREAFSRSVWNFGYHLQAAHYLHGARALGLDYDRFAFVAVKKRPDKAHDRAEWQRGMGPRAIALYELTAADIHDGNRELRPLLTRYAECERTGSWPGYSPDVEMLQLPRWAPKQIDERLAEV